MHHMIASFPGLCAGGHERGNEADHMIDFIKVCSGPSLHLYLTQELDRFTHKYNNEHLNTRKCRTLWGRA